MNHTKDDGDTGDLDALRNFRAELAEPSSARLAAIGARAAMRPRRRALAPALVGAAAALALVAGATAVALTNGTEHDAGPAASSSPARPGTEAVQGGPDSKVPSEPDPVDAAGHDAAVDLLERLAVDAQAQGSAPPVAVPAGQLLYVSGTGTTAGSYQHELWMEPDGSIVVMIRRHDGGVQTVVSPDPGNPKDNMAQEIAEWRLQLARNGPSIQQPTPAFLAALPTDPQALLDVLVGAAGGQSAWSTDRTVMSMLSDTLYRVEPLVAPTLRAALYRAVAMLPSVRSTGEVVEVDGRRVYVIGQSERDLEEQLLIDADTGRVIGQRTVEPGSGTGTVLFSSLWSFAVVPTVGATP